MWTGEVVSSWLLAGWGRRRKGCGRGCRPSGLKSFSPNGLIVQRSGIHSGDTIPVSAYVLVSGLVFGVWTWLVLKTVSDQGNLLLAIGFFTCHKKRKRVNLMARQAGEDRADQPRGSGRRASFPHSPVRRAGRSGMGRRARVPPRPRLLYLLNQARVVHSVAL